MITIRKTDNGIDLVVTGNDASKQYNKLWEECRYNLRATGFKADHDHFHPKAWVESEHTAHLTCPANADLEVLALNLRQWGGFDKNDVIIAK